MLLWRVCFGLAAMASAASFGTLHFSGNPATDGWTRMGNSQDTGIFFSGNKTGPSFDLYMRTFSFSTGWTRADADTLIGDTATWAGWNVGDTVIGLGFVGIDMQIESAWYKFDFQGLGPWPTTGNIHSGGVSTVQGALSIYQHSHQWFRGLDNRYTDMEVGSTVFGGGGGQTPREHRSALRGWAVQSSLVDNYPLVSSTQMFVNYTMLVNRLGIPLAPIDWYRMKLQLGAYGPGVGQEAMVMPINTPAATPIPEPFTMSLLAAGLGLAAARRRKRSKK